MNDKILQISSEGKRQDKQYVTLSYPVLSSYCLQSIATLSKAVCLMHTNTVLKAVSQMLPVKTKKGQETGPGCSKKHQMDIKWQNQE